MNAPSEPGPRTWLAMSLIAAAVLIYEVAITRLLSVVLWYHFAFLSISIAMLGLGAAGAWLSLRSDRSSAVLEPALLIAGISMPLSVVVIVRARPAILALGLGQAGWLSVLAVTMAVPMFALGTAICRLLLEARGKAVARMYGADLLGATAGALLVVPLLSWIATPRLLALTGVLPLASLGVMHGVRKPAWIVCAGLTLLAALWGTPFEVGYSKLHSERGDFEPVHEVWTSTARIAVFDHPVFSPTPDIPWGWGYGARFEPRPAREMWIDQDGSAGTPIEHLPGAPEALEHLLFDVTSLGYQLARPARVCIIGAGGGRDIVTALALGARRVDAVELNAAIVALLRGPLAEFSGNIYGRPGVRAIVGEGRSFLTRNAAQYDLLQISLVDSWAATAAGAYALSENYLYTVEALRLYLQRLAPGGILSISRWTDRVQPFESVRLALMAQEALRQHGVRSPRDHLLFASGGNVGTLLIGQRPFDAAAVRALDRIADERGFVRHWPYDPQQPPQSLVPVALQTGSEIFVRSGIDVAPPTDDRPFFFQAEKMFQWGSEVEALPERDMNLDSVATLRHFLTILGALIVALFFAPFARRDKRPSRAPGLWIGSSYFLLVGAAFMLIELPWVQQSMLLVGHPSHAAAVTLAALLLGAGIGSSLAARMSTTTLGWLLLALPAAAALAVFAIEPVFRHALQYPAPLRVLIACVSFAAPGSLMGLALPAGFMRFGEEHKAWFWAVNGAASVLASVSAVALSIALGFRATTLIAVALYIAAAALFHLYRPGRIAENAARE